MAKFFRQGAEDGVRVVTPYLMPPRLLSLLSLIETAVADHGRQAAVTRSADYRKGVARMTFADGSGSIVLQNFQLADGQLCLRVDLRRAGVAEAEETAIYPQAISYDWADAAARIARTWCAMAAIKAAQPATMSA